ncbi:AraC family transcriptional regulator [Mucilaginibacter robiniae]|uniref:AraC family transcriptional regulator n=1 Tax=Mucilaginibacter robiniae TaxID=2728022 RepID=A0A7L5E4V9_9SPHI|nr:helix-turn-helix domain-containing protein [Mucilaginibacter robiniae]QJD97339.1 AraC family transcriptional regulator [Mucilaginibacter robiniae]
MNPKDKIPVHRMDDWHYGIYLKSFGMVSSARPDYDLSKAHRHDFYYGVLLEKGMMALEVDFQPFHLGEHTIFFTYSGQVHRIVSARLEQGWFFPFDPAIIDQQLKNILDQSLSEVMIATLDQNKSAKFSTSLQELKAVYDEPGQRFSQPVLHALLTAFLYQTTGACFSLERNTLTSYPLRSIEITKNFRQILRQNFRSIKRPSAYAARMHISTSHLNDTVRSVTGFPVTYFIQQEAMREAQRLLYYSALSVKEIALSLGFDDAQYFSRLFTKVVGLSPLKWRTQNRN